MKQSDFIERLGWAFDAGWKERNRRPLDGKIMSLPVDDEFQAAREKFINDVVKEVTNDRDL